jgi:hypothetical protein
LSAADEDRNLIEFGVATLTAPRREDEARRQFKVLLTAADKK